MLTALILAQVAAHLPTHLWQHVLKAGENRALTQVRLNIDQAGNLKQAVVIHTQRDWLPEHHHQRADKLMPGSVLNTYKSRVGPGEEIWHYTSVKKDGQRCELHTEQVGNDPSTVGKKSFDECHIPLADVPPALVKKAIAVLPKGELKEVTRYARDFGQVTYELEIEGENDAEAVVFLRANGDDVLTRIFVKARPLPAPFAEAVEKVVPGGTIGEVNRRVAPNEPEEMVVRTVTGGTTHILRFTTKGELLRHQVELPALIDTDVYRKPGYQDAPKAY